MVDINFLFVLLACHLVAWNRWGKELELAVLLLNAIASLRLSSTERLMMMDCISISMEFCWHYYDVFLEMLRIPSCICITM